MTTLSKPYIYLDVNGTDRSSKVVGIPKIYGGLSEVGKATIVLDNHDGALSSSFSKHQVVSISLARAAFTARSTYFTGGGTAPVGAWNNPYQHCANDTVTLEANKLKIYASGADPHEARAYTAAAESVPFCMEIWAYATNANDQAIEVVGWNAKQTNYYWLLANIGAQWAIYTRIGGATAQRAIGGTFAVNTWYCIRIYVSSTGITVNVKDVFKNDVWAPAAQTFDSLSSHYLSLGCIKPSVAAYTFYDSCLILSSSTSYGNQRFEGYIDEAGYNPASELSVSTITLRCSGYESELTDQYDETYGRDTATFTPSYGTTDDIAAQVNNLIPSGWTYRCPDCAIHDKQVVSINTRRVDAINEFIVSTPYLGWFVIPPKCLCMVMPDTNPAPDAWTDATTGWVRVGGTSLTTDNAYTVDGSWDLCLYALNAGTYSAYYDTDALWVDLTKTGILHLYYATGANITNLIIKLYDDRDIPRYWYYTLPLTSFGAPSNLQHFIIRCPDSNGNHGWVPVNSPYIFTSIKRVTLEAVTTGAGYFYWDTLYFVGALRTTSKYTLTAPISVLREDRSDNITRAIIKYSAATLVMDDATAQAVDGLHEVVVNDQNITTLEGAIAVGNGILNAEGYGVTSDPVVVEYLDPGDMYNVQLGDTLTVTDAAAGLSNAKRTLVAREDRVNEREGWATTLYLSGQYPETTTQKLLEMSKRKRY